MQLLEALLVDTVAAPKHGDVSGGFKQVFTAHRAVSVHAVHNADMACLHIVVIAAVASFTMEAVLSPADSAYATAVAVELLLRGVIVKEIAFQAKILPKGHATRPAIPRDWLAIPAQFANDLSDGLAIEGVPLLGIGLIVILGQVVAVPTPKNLSTTRRYHAAAPPIVLAAMSVQLTAPSVIRSGTTTLAGKPIRHGLPARAAADNRDRARARGTGSGQR